MACSCVRVSARVDCVSGTLPIVGHRCTRHVCCVSEQQRWLLLSHAKVNINLVPPTVELEAGLAVVAWEAARVHHLQGKQEEGVRRAHS